MNDSDGAPAPCSSGIADQAVNAGIGNVQAYWDSRYAQRESMWSGKVNQTLAEVLQEIGALPLAGASRTRCQNHGAANTASALSSATALDLGCGEGGDVLWLASHGIKAHGVDVSALAVERARARADRENLSAATFETADLEAWVPAMRAQAQNIGARYDLVTASFFQSRVHLDRQGILRRVIELLKPGGYLVLLSHATPPPWSAIGRSQVHESEAGGGGQRGVCDHPMPTIESERAICADLPAVTEILAEVRCRNVTDPEGNPAMLEDLVYVVRRES